MHLCEGRLSIPEGSYDQEMSPRPGHLYVPREVAVAIWRQFSSLPGTLGAQPMGLVWTVTIWLLIEIRKFYHPFQIRAINQTDGCRSNP